MPIYRLNGKVFILVNFKTIKMELIGKKVVRNSKFEYSMLISVNSINGHIKISKMAMNKIGLKITDEVGFAYDEGKAFLFVGQDHNGFQLDKNGSFSSRFHSRALADIFKIEEDKFTLLLNTEPIMSNEYPDVELFILDLAPNKSVLKEVTESATSQEKELLS